MCHRGRVLDLTFITLTFRGTSFRFHYLILIWKLSLFKICCIPGKQSRKIATGQPGLHSWLHSRSRAIVRDTVSKEKPRLKKKKILLSVLETPSPLNTSFQGQWGDPVGIGVCCRAWWPEFSLGFPHSERRKLILKVVHWPPYPQYGTFLCVKTHCTHAHTHCTHTYSLSK